MRSTICCLSLLVACGACKASDVETYLGLTDFRHVKTDVTDRVACGDEAWESGNFFRNGDSARLFSPGADTVTVKLKAAHFPYTPETSIFGRVRNSQVGIFADVTLKDGAAAAPGTRGISGRLVFYSEDYVQGQLRIPDVNTNIYGPVPYPGGGLSLKLTLLEFDQSTKDQLSDTLLKGIADLGIKASAGVPTYLQGPLGALFQSALAGAKSKDDVFGRITFALDDRNGAENPNTTPLRTGDLVIVRASKRDVRIDWGLLCYNPFTGDVTRGRKTKSQTPRVKQAAQKNENGLATTNRPEMQQAKQAGDEGVNNAAVSDLQTDALVTNSTEEAPGIAFITLSLLKNAGADAGRIQDALAYEQFVQELNNRATTSGLVANTKGVLDALSSHALSKELHRLASVLEMDVGAVSQLERFDAASKLASVLQASALATKSFDVTQQKANASCKYLGEEVVQAQEVDRVLVRLEKALPGVMVATDAALASNPTTCADALVQRKAVINLLSGKSS